MAKDLEFRGNSYKELMAFPQEARKEAGFQLSRVQDGGYPADWKPMQSVGAGVQEIRLHEAEGAFRVIYVARFAEAVFVLHCFQKKTQKTAPMNLELATRRYRDLVEELENGK